MRVIISGRGVTVTPALRARVEEKVGKLPKILSKILEVRVVLSAEKYRRTALLTLQAKRRTFHSEQTAPDLSSALDLAFEALDQQVRRTKDRLHRRKPRPTSLRIPAGRAAMPRARWDGEGEDGIGVVREPLQSKPMSVEEAVMQFRLAEGQFLVFTNASTKLINVLYRKQNGTVGLIEPSL